MNVAVLDDYQDVAREYGDWDSLPAGSGLTVFTDHVDDHDVLVRRLAGFDVVVAMRERTPFPRALLCRLSDLRLLVTTGHTNAAIDVAAARELGIVVSATGAPAAPTAELAWGLIIALLRRIPAQDSAVRSGGWQTHVGIGLEGRTLGLVGLGTLGSRMAVLGRAFGMRVIAWSEHLTHATATRWGAEAVSKQELFRTADIVSLHVRLSERTRLLVGEAELRSMRRGACLVNTSRGGLVDEAALLGALRDGRIAGAALDVYQREPLPEDDPLRTAPNTVLTPHIGYVTAETYAVFFADVVADVLAFADGSPVRVLVDSKP